MQFGVKCPKTCMQCVHASTELPIYIPSLVVGYAYIVCHMATLVFSPPHEWWLHVLLMPHAREREKMVKLLYIKYKASNCV